MKKKAKLYKLLLKKVFNVEKKLYPGVKVKELIICLDQLLDTLPDRTKKVLVFYFGLEDGVKKTLEQAGKEFCVTRERVRQIAGKGLRMLRHPSRKERLNRFIVPTQSEMIELIDCMTELRASKNQLEQEKRDLFLSNKLLIKRLEIAGIKIDFQKKDFQKERLGRAFQEISDKFPKGLVTQVRNSLMRSSIDYPVQLRERLYEKGGVKSIPGIGFNGEEVLVEIIRILRKNN